MKHIKRLLTLFMVFFLLSSSLFTTVKAEHEDVDYYYENYNITVQVYDDRRFEVTESLDVYYNQECHGIIRDIPTSSTTEGYNITNVKVEGADYKVSEDGSSIYIRIGSADFTVLGLQHYVITYTIEHYQDYDAVADYVYMNLLPNELDTYVNHFKGQIILNDGLVGNKQTVTSGTSGSTVNPYAQYSVEGNVYYYTAENIPPHKGVTTMIELDEGAFIHAKEYPFDYIINNEVIEMNYTEWKDIDVTASVTLTNKNDYSVEYDYEFLFGSNDEVEVRACQIDGGSPKDYGTDQYITFTIAPHTTIEYDLNYTIHYKAIEQYDYLNLFLIHSYTNSKVEHIKFTLNLSSIDDYYVYLGRNTSSEKKLNYSKTDSGLVIESYYPIYEGEYLQVSTYYSNDIFYRDYPSTGLFSIIGGAALAIYLVVVSLLNRRSVEQHNVPANLNSWELGYLYNNMKFTTNVLSSITLYWASKGYLTIHETYKGTWYLVKEKDADKYMNHYESSLFKSLFSKKFGGNKVSSSTLKGFGPYIDVANDAIIEKYSTEPYKIQKNNLFGYNVLCGLLGVVVYFVLSYTAVYFNTESLSRTITNGLIIGIPICLTIMLYNALYKKSKIWIKILVILIISGIFSFQLEVVYNLEGQDQVLMALFIALFIGHFMYDINRYTPLGRELMQQIKGFRKFLKNYRVNNEDDEMYEYDMYPYAVALGIEKAWTNKFKATTREQVCPPWYVYSSHDRAFDHERWCKDCHAYHTYMAHRFYYEKPTYTGGGSSGGSGYSGGSSSSSSSYSGGGSSYSGGGSSGGGSGGGGSKSW